MRHLLLLCILPLVLFISMVRSDEDKKAVSERVSQEKPKEVLSRTGRNADWSNLWIGEGSGWGLGGDSWGMNDWGNNWGGNWGWNWGGDWEDQYDWDNSEDSDWDGNWMYKGRCRPPWGCPRCKYVNSNSPTYCKNFCLDRHYCFCRQ